MDKKLKSVLAIALSCLFVGSGIAATALAANNDKKEETQPVTETAETSDSGVNSKDETVYVLAGADGSVKKIIVSDWIKNSLNSDTIDDQSGLTDVENVKGDETYTLNGENMKIWDAQGNDIYYRGNITKDLPVNLKLNYTLDGKAISPDELAGKSGRVTIRYTYENNQYEYVEIDGQQEKIYVPFAMLTGLLLDSDHFRNVEVTNGKMLGDGDKMAVIGIAFPGLKSNLDIDSDEIDIPDYVEISADVNEFSLTNTVTIATNEVFNAVDTSKMDSLDDLDSSLGKLTDAVSQLLDGSSQLYDGLCTLLEKSGELVDGIDKLAAGAAQLKDGAASLDNGAGTLQGGISTLSSGLSQIAANNDTLNGGSKQVFETLLATANSQIAASGITAPELTIENYQTVIDGIVASLSDEAIKKQVTDAVKANEDQIRAGVTQAVSEQVRPKVEEAVRAAVKATVVSTATQMTVEQYDAAVAAGQVPEAVQAQVNAAIEAQMATDKAKAQIEAGLAQQMASDNLKATIEGNVQKQIDALVAQNLPAALEKAQAGAQSLTALKGQLDSYATFYYGLSTYTDKVSEAAAGAGQLKDGTDTLKAGTEQLSAGAAELYNGILTLKDGAPALVSGVTQLRDGALKLSDGLKAFKEQGVDKLSEAAGGIGKLVTRFKATVDVSKDYKTFTGLSGDMDGQVKFVYRTDSIGK